MVAFEFRGTALRLLCALWLAAVCLGAQASGKNLAPGFESLSRGEKILLIPIDVELFSLSAGGVAEPKADWTAAARQHMSEAIERSLSTSGLTLVRADEALADEFAEELGLEAAVSRSISLHHGFGGGWALPSKGGMLDWSFGDALTRIQDRTQARYALFTWVRDSYTSPERMAMIAAVALLSLGNVSLAGGRQEAHASLVDLQTGRVVWFARLYRSGGDLRKAEHAEESVSALLNNFPPSK
jgi:hypothetical protein